MTVKINFTLFFSLVSLGLFAQGKLYITPHINCFVAAYKGVDSVNKKQDFIKTKNFTRKDFLVGIKLTYLNKRFAVSAGIEEGIYASGFYYKKEPQNLANRIDSKETIAEGNGPNIIFIEVQTELSKYLNIKMPKWLSKNPEKPYLVVSKLAPFIGFERRQMQQTFINDFVEYNSAIQTSLYGNIPGSHLFHLNNSRHFLLRAGFDWVFYNEGKRRFIITFMYQLAFKDAGYWRYHFEKPSRGIDFYYQTTTRGNGFSVKAGLPIKLFEINKK